MTEEGEEFSFQDLGIEPGNIINIPEVDFTREEYGPVQIIAWWVKGNKEPIFLVTNMALAEEACYWYKKRFRIETFFSDQKSRGFHLHKSHLDKPERLATLMIAACLAYIWMVYLGDFAKRTGWNKVYLIWFCLLILFKPPPKTTAAVLFESSLFAISPPQMIVGQPT